MLTSKWMGFAFECPRFVPEHTASVPLVQSRFCPRRFVPAVIGCYQRKMKVVSLVERGGERRNVVVPAVTGKTLREVLNNNVSKATSPATAVVS